MGLRILPMKELQGEMSSGVGYYEGEFVQPDSRRTWRSGVPLVLVGIARSLHFRSQSNLTPGYHVGV